MSHKTVRINLHEVLNAAHCHDRQYPAARDLTKTCQFPELYLQYEADEAGTPVGPSILYIGDGGGCGPEDAASDIVVLYRDGTMTCVDCELAKTLVNFFIFNK